MSSVVMSKHASVNALTKDEIRSWRVAQRSLQQARSGRAGLVRHSYAQVAEIRKGLGGNCQHDLPGYRTRIFDGNHIAGTHHRLKETRNSTASPLPGKSVVVLDPRFKAIVDYFPLEDGHAQERTALDDLLKTVKRNDLWIGDRSTLKPIYEIQLRNAAFIIRQHAQLIGDRLGKRKKVGPTVYERSITVSNGRNGTSLVLRRIEVELDEPSRNGDKTTFSPTYLRNLPMA